MTYTDHDELFQRMVAIGFSDDEAFDACERAAILEYEGQMTRNKAETQAMREKRKSK